MKNYKVEFEGNIIEYTIVRKSVKNISLKIKKDLSVEVVANRNVSVKYIEDLVLRKATWILKTIEKLENKKIVPKNQYVTDEKVYFLGNSYDLEVIEHNKEYVEVADNRILLFVKDVEDFEKKEKVIYKWYRENSAKYFQEYLDNIYPMLKVYGVEKPELKLRKMKSCWGTCHYKKGFIVLNVELIKYPKEAIEYVIVHELVHFIHSNHSKDFYEMVGRIMPDWKVRKALLK